MPKLVQTKFDGIIPRISDRLLPDTNAITAHNCDLEAGNLRTLKDALAVEALSSSTKQGLYRYRGNFLTFDTDVDVVQGPFADDQYERIFYTQESGKPQVRGVLNGAEVQFDLGIPKPTKLITAVAQQKTSTSWTREWHGYYEEPDATQKDATTFTEGTDITVDQPGKTYVLNEIPAREEASSQATYILYFDAYDASGSLMGRCYPQISAYSNNTDFYLDGAKVTGQQTIDGSELTLELSYDTSRASDYEIDRYYVYTFVSAFGEEGRPSNPSALVSVDPTQDAKLTGMDASISGTHNITKKRIYRTVTGNAGTAYQFVAELDLGTSTYVDSISDTDTAEVLPSTGWNQPDEELQGIVSVPGEFLAGFSGRSIKMCVPGQPHAWPDDYQYEVDYDIVGLGVSGNTVIVCTTGVPYLLIGIHPDSMTLQKIALPQSCASKRSIFQLRNLVGYASPDGIVLFTGSHGELVTSNIWDREDWQNLAPSSMIAGVHDDRVFLFGSTQTIIFDPDFNRSKIVTIDADAQAVYNDIEADTLYYIWGDMIYEWAGDTTEQTLIYRGKNFEFPNPLDWSCARVNAVGYPLTLRLYANDIKVIEYTVNSDVAFRLPKHRREKRWSIEVESRYDINEVSVATSMGEIA